ncbi:MAG: RNA polymerase factor sigma-54 [Chlamydiales bacterium]
MWKGLPKFLLFSGEKMVSQHFAQQQKQIHRLILSPQMQQALNLLQLPIQELSSLICEELTLNPLLEFPDGEEEIDIFPEMERDSRLTYSQREEEDLKSFIENTISYEYTLQDSLNKQAHESFNDPQMVAWAAVLIGYLDDDGFLGTDLIEISLLENIPLQKLEETLREIQTFEPLGVGARSCQEALLIQLRAFGKENSLAYRIIDTSFDDMLHNRIPLIAKKNHTNAQEIHAVILREIAPLDLHPGSHLSAKKSHFLTPDVTILFHDERFSIEINEGRLSSLRFNPTYLHMLEDETLPEETKEYIKEKITSSKWLLRNLHERNHTLYRITEEIIQFQRLFLTDPKGQLTPLTMKEIAEKLELHESTIARAVSKKILCCPRGIFPLRSFFTNAYVTEAGENISANTVKECVQQIIAHEDKRAPFSDEVISQMIKEKGIDCARRTVAKYRQELHIGNASMRKSHA